MEKFPDKVTLKCVDDQTTRSMALQTGEIDIAYNLKTENLVEFEEMTITTSRSFSLFVPPMHS